MPQSDDIEVTVSGLDELGEQLEQLDLALQKRILFASLKSAGEVFLAPMKERCPVSVDAVAESTNTTRLVQGALRRDLKVRAKADRAAPTVYVGPGKDTFHVARWIENGFDLTTHGRKRQRRVIRHIKATPFIRPAFDANTEKAVEAFANALNDGLQAELGGKFTPVEGAA
jgi:HK97 gp10 family phage protein